MVKVRHNAAKAEAQDDDNVTNAKQNVDKLLKKIQRSKKLSIEECCNPKNYNSKVYYTAKTHILHCKHISVYWYLYTTHMLLHLSFDSSV
jgi:hypothetical protein